MLLTLEHNGTKEAVDASLDLLRFLQEETEHNIETIVGSKEIGIYGYLNNKHIFTTSVPLQVQDKPTVLYILNNLKILQ